jgi:peptide/nickel transport system permease protein
MLTYLLRRLVYMFVLLILVSVVSFVIITLPPGDYVTTQIANLEASGAEVDEALLENLRQQYGLNRPIHVQYGLWITKFVQGDFGMSFLYNRPVKSLIGERLALTMAISLLTLVFTYVVAIPIGIYSATHQYSPLDYVFSVFGFVGLATPNFLLALVLMFVGFKLLNFNMGGLFSLQYVSAAWSWGKFVDLLKHVWVPIVVIGTAATASIIRVMRGCLLDELRKQYVTTARTKGVRERVLLFKYPVRIAMNPIISTIGWTLPTIVSGSTITAIVLGLPTTGPLLVTALLSQDMYLAGSFIMFLSILTVVGTILSDILLAAADPRIRYT